MAKSEWKEYLFKLVLQFSISDHFTKTNTEVRESIGCPSFLQNNRRYIENEVATVAKHLIMCRMGLGAQAGMPVLLKTNCEENEVATVG